MCAWLHTHPDVGTEHAQLSRYPSHLSKAIKKSPWESVSSRASGSGHCSELWPGDGAEHDSRRLGSERPATLRVPQVGTREPTQTSGRPTLTFPALPGRSVKVLQGQTRRPRPGMQVRRPASHPPSACPRAQGHSAPAGGTWPSDTTPPTLPPLGLPPGRARISTHFNHRVRTETLTGTWGSQNRVLECLLRHPMGLLGLSPCDTRTR